MSILAWIRDFLEEEEVVEEEEEEEDRFFTFFRFLSVSSSRWPGVKKVGPALPLDMPPFRWLSSPLLLPPRFKSNIIRNISSDKMPSFHFDSLFSFVSTFSSVHLLSSEEDDSVKMN